MSIIKNPEDDNDDAKDSCDSQDVIKPFADSLHNDSAYNTQDTADGNVLDINHGALSKTNDTPSNNKPLSPHKQARKKLVPKLPVAPRRSSRLSMLYAASESGPAQSLGKHNLEPDANNNPDAKRTKARKD
jgi:hypothetical protein